MSNKYSLGGYKIAIRAKSRVTLIVEGRDDKEFFTRFKLRCFPETSLDIDTADILGGADFSGLGHKAKIDLVLASDLQTGNLAGKLRAFVDREWEGLVDELSGDALRWCPPVQVESRTVTAGHSLENYSFSLDFVVGYLHHFGAEVAFPSVIEGVVRDWPEAVLFSAAFSEASRRLQCITRCEGLFDVSDFSLVSGRVGVLPPLQVKLDARGVDGSSVIALALQLYQGKWRDERLAHKAEFNCHGHIAEAILWNLVGCSACMAGVPVERARELALGRRDERRRQWYTWLIESGAANGTEMCVALVGNGQAI